MPKRIWEPTVVLDAARIPLTQGKWAVIDLADLPLVRGMTWQTKKHGRTFYATSSYGVPMHRLLLGFGPGDPRIDHRDGNGLNNRRVNLREATPGQNNANSRPIGGASRFKGVSRCSSTGRWKAQIGMKGGLLYLGLFDDEIEAARAYDETAIATWGEFARPNFPKA